jgi:drug/metabolite transporter (DMT)-like permease
VNSDDYVRGVLGMVAAAALFSVMACLIRLGPGISFFTSAFYRFGVGLCVLGTLALFRKIRLEFRNSQLLLLRGLLGGVSVVLFYMSIVKIGIAKGTVISYSYPLFATLAGAVFLKERIRPAAWLLLAAALAGMVLLTGGFGRGGAQLVFDPWVLLSLLGAVIAGLAVVCIKNLLSTDTRYSIFMAQCLFGFWIVAIPANTAPMRLGWVGGVLLLGIGLTATAAQLLMTGSFAYVSVATGSLLGILTPVFNVLLGLLLFGEVMSLGELLGTLVILVSCLGIVVLGREPVPVRR